MIRFRCFLTRPVRLLFSGGRQALPAVMAALLTLGVYMPMAKARDMTVVTSLRPLQGIVAAVMAGAGKPQLLLTRRVDPHHASLRPSQARLLAQANVIFIVSRDLERFLKRPLAALARDGAVVELARIANIRLLPHRRLDPPGAGSSGRDGHAVTDWHVWTDPLAAAAMAEAAAEVLARQDAAHAALYRKNAAALKQRLSALTEAWAKRLKPLAGRPFIVTHDAFQYFDVRFGLSPLAAVQPDDETLPGPRRMSAILRLARQHEGLCVLHGPGHDRRWAQLLRREAGARAIEVDVLGYGIREEGAAFLERYYDGLGTAHVRCLKGRP